MADRPASQRRAAVPARLVFLICPLLMFALVVFASFAPASRLWGVHHLIYYPPTLRIAVLAFVALTFVPAVSRGVYRLLSGVTILLGTPSAAQRVMTVAIVIGFIACFLGFRSTTHLLGDGQLQARLTERLAASPDIGYAYLADFAVKESVAPATSFVVFAGARALHSAAGWSPVLIWQVFDALLGGVFVFLLLSVVRRIGGPLPLRMLALLAALSSGAIVLFFGYIETYAPMIVFVTGYFLASFQTLQSKSSIALPTVLCCLAAVFHVQALLLGPSLVFLALWTLVSKRSPHRVPGTALALALVTAAGTAVLAILPKTEHFILPLFGHNGVHGALSPAHLLDVLNEIGLIVPTIPLFAALCIAHWIPGRKLLDTGEMAFAILVLVPSFLFLIFFFPELGMARDWDLFVLPAASFLVLGLALSRRFLGQPGMTAHLERHLAPALGIAASIVIPWIGVNANETRSVERYENVIQMDATNPGYGLEILAMYYRDRGREDLAAQTYQDAYNVSKNPRHLVAACSSRLRIGDFEAPTATLRDYLARDPDHLLAREVYVEALVRQSATDEVIRVCREGIEIHPESPFFYLYLGIAQHIKGNATESNEAFDACRRLNPPRMFIDMIEKVTKGAAQEGTK